MNHLAKKKIAEIFLQLAHALPDVKNDKFLSSLNKNLETVHLRSHISAEITAFFQKRKDFSITDSSLTSLSSLSSLSSVSDVTVKKQNEKLDSVTTSKNTVFNESLSQDKELPEKKPIERELIHTRLLRSKASHPFYEELMRKIAQCDQCGQSKIGFIPSYGVNFPYLGKTLEKDKNESEKPLLKKMSHSDEKQIDMVIIADPPMNFYVKGKSPSTLRSCLVNGQTNDWRELIGKEENWSAADAITKEYKGYFPDIVTLFAKTITMSGIRLERIILSSIGRCFIQKNAFRDFFGEEVRIACRDWLLDELIFIKEQSAPRVILLMGSHFGRSFLGVNTDLDHLRERKDLNWQGIPVRFTYHPLQWMRRGPEYNKAKSDIMDIYRKFFS